MNTIKKQISLRILSAVTAPTEARVARLMQREGISRKYALQRIGAQKSNEYFAEHCDFTLDNAGTMAEFEQKCRDFFTEELKHV